MPFAVFGFAKNEPAIDHAHDIDVCEPRAVDNKVERWCK